MLARLPSVVEGVVRTYRQALEREFPDRLRRLAVFGSVARGEANEDSDTDVLVLLDRVDSRERGRVIDLGTELGLAHDLVLAPLVLSVEAWRELERRERLLPREIDRDGVDV